MSELKWNWAYVPYLDPPEKQKESAQNAGYVKVVSESEADKVIAEKDKELRHHKYKRCLAMAGLCEIGISYWDDDEQEGGWEYQKLRHYIRWKKRWLELAEVFK